jgi:DNA-directed RNA polymerase subunit RPC12/RpoP
MEDKTSDTVKAGRSFDGAYGFSFAIALGLILFIAGLIITLTLGQGTSIGLIFGIPLLIAGVVLPLIMMRGGLKQTIVSGACPYCGTPIKTTDATIRLNCPACSKKIVVRDLHFEPAE